MATAHLEQINVPNHCSSIPAHATCGRLNQRSQFFTLLQRHTHPGLILAYICRMPFISPHFGADLCASFGKWKLDYSQLKCLNLFYNAVANPCLMHPIPMQVNFWNQKSVFIHNSLNFNPITTKSK